MQPVLVTTWPSNMQMQGMILLVNDVKSYMFIHAYTVVVFWSDIMRTQTFLFISKTIYTCDLLTIYTCDLLTIYTCDLLETYWRHKYCNVFMCVSLLNKTCLSFADVDECESNPCKNGAVCNDDFMNYTCTCAAGYTGYNCETSMISNLHW